MKGARVDMGGFESVERRCVSCGGRVYYCYTTIMKPHSH